MRRVAAAFACLLVAGAALAADPVTVRSAWMRPALAGTETASAYLDIDSTIDAVLVGATSPAAERVDLVRVREIGNPASEETVAAIPVPAGRTTRLPFRGDHLRLVGMKRTAGTGDAVPVTLAFREANGRRFDVGVDLVVRGLLLQPQTAPDSRDAATPSGPVPAPR